MVREIMYVIRHGRTFKAWIDPKDIHKESDVPFTPPDYPTKEMIAEKAEREAEKATLAEQQRLKEQHDEWNTKTTEEVRIAAAKPKVPAPIIEPPKPPAPVIETPKPKRKYTKRKGGKK